ncbi:MAG: DUF885 domain-containing protein [bacterium]|nr:DUF885 domain-containing protein [bacterium]
MPEQSHPIFALSSDIVDEVTALSPTLATYSGIVGHDDRWPDLSPSGHATAVAAFRDMAARIAALPPADDRWDSLAIKAAHTFVADRIDSYDYRDELRDLDSIASSAQDFVETFDHMDKSTAVAWENICTRLETIGDALSGYQATLAQGLRERVVVARRQAMTVAEQCRVASSPDSGLDTLPAALAESGVADGALNSRLEAGISTAKSGFAGFGDWLSRSYLDGADPEDAVGEDRYVRAAHRFLGMTIDPAATYQWGWGEVARLRARMEEVADEILPGATIAEALQILKSDPARAAATREDYISFMKARNEIALERLAGTHFDVPDEIREVDVKLASPGGALGAYYVGPSEDFTRPGSVWWSFGTSPGPFPLYDEVSTLYHEGFPGHHLQVGVQVTRADKLSRLHRLLVWYPGLGEGWALYAEGLMDQMGFLDKPDYVFGYLAAQMLRACRVVIDIGSHLKLATPQDQPFHPGEEWSFELGVEMLQEYATLEKVYAESEVTRYLGWPGQAISYKVGEKAIRDIRAALEQRDEFDVKQFHANLLEIGPVGLDLVRELLLAE